MEKLSTLTQEEQDRLFECLFYLYFTRRNENQIKDIKFWNTISQLCILYNINSNIVTQCIRILRAEVNEPTEKEIYYLLNKLEVSVRTINRISGIYWQKQLKFQEEFEHTKPLIHRKITDVIYKKSIQDFVLAIYDLSGILINIKITK